MIRKAIAVAFATGVAGCAFLRQKQPPSEKLLDAMHEDCSDRLTRRSFLEQQTPRRAGTFASWGGASRSDDGTGKVVIYGAKWCRPCDYAKAYLSRRGIPWIEKDVDDDTVRAEMNDLLVDAGVWGRGIPVIVARGVVMTGFMPCAIDEAMKT